VPIGDSTTAHIYQGDVLRVRWMRYQGTFPAKDFLLGYPEDFARFVQRVREMADTGTILLPTLGHQLKGKYRELHQFKMSLTRSWGVRDSGVYVVLHAGLKKKAKEQVADYERALMLRDNYFNRTE
jgi:hypothetical protein